MASFEQVRLVMARIFEVPAETIELNSRRYDFRLWDSFGHLNLILELESLYGAKLPWEKVSAIRDVHGVVEALKQARGA